jgi:hypothetical protein
MPKGVLKMFVKKIQTVGSISDFMRPDWKEVQKETKITKMASFAAVAVSALSPLDAEAKSVGDVILHAFDPIIEMIQASAYPVGFVMIAFGFILIMMGQQSRGMSFIKWACIGYVGMQFAPALMGILYDVGAQIKAGM